MKESTKRRIAELGLDIKDFEPNAIPETDRLDAIEDAIAELCEVIFNG